MARIETLIVDDQDDMRLLLRTVIELANGCLSVVAEASSGPDALEQAERWDPQVVVLDAMMPEMSGLETAVRLRRKSSSLVLILCSAYLSDEVILRARDAGFNAWLPKDQVHVLPDLIRSTVGVA